MLNNYLKIALRTLHKHKGYGGINVTGLAIGLACCLLIVLYVRDELSYDRFHANAERTYRLIREDGTTQSSVAVEAPLAPTLAREYPEVEAATRVFRYWFTPLVSRGDEGFYEEDLFFTDTAFFDVFSFALVRGDRETALDEPYAMLLTETAARTYFGDEDPMGETLTLNAAHHFTVTGILADPPRTSHFTFDILASIESIPDVIDWPGVMENWGLGAFPTYVVLAEGTDPAQFEAKLQTFDRRRFGADNPLPYFLQPLTDIHLHSHYRGEIEANSDVSYVWLLSGIALIILLLACINYTNLATARFAQRAHEVGIRKAVGAHRRQLALQFLGESVLMALIALLTAVVLLELMLPAFNVLIGERMTFDVFDDAGLLTLLVGIALVAGLAAGSYPAFFLSGFRPSAVLKGEVEGSRRAPLRRVLVVMQYAIAVVLIAGTGIIYQQLDYVSTKKLGFEKEQVVVVPIRDEQMKQRPEVAKAAFLALPEVTHASATTSVPGTAFPGTTDFRRANVQDDEETFRVFLAWIDDAYVETLGMELAAGRTVSADRPTDEEDVVLLNEEAVRAFGWARPEDAVGEVIETWGGEQRRIAGVLHDFHFASLHEPIQPVVFFPQFDETSGLVLRLRTDDLPAALNRLETTWRRLSTAQPFTYSFLDQDLDRLYVAERRWVRLIGSAALFALFIACLGLFGLAAFAAQQRTKEIGIRKVLGASASSIAVLLSGEFAKLVAVAFIVGAPVAYVAAQRWLTQFAYHVEPGISVFLSAGILTLLIALLTVSAQSIKAALADPVKSLRHE